MVNVDTMCVTRFPWQRENPQCESRVLSRLILSYKHLSSTTSYPHASSDADLKKAEEGEKETHEGGEEDKLLDTSSGAF